MLLTVKERGQFVATMRYIQVWLMETLAAWVPTTPEMEVKLRFGEHLWDAAQHADALGKRTFELRLSLQYSLKPSEGYVALLADVAAITATPQRLAAVYDVLLPALAARYRRYLDETDKLSDAPTVRIFNHELADVDRMIEDGNALRAELPSLQLNDDGWVAALQAREAALDPIATAASTTVGAEA
jgi:hypothetical protein